MSSALLVALFALTAARAAHADETKADTEDSPADAGETKTHGAPEHAAVPTQDVEGAEETSKRERRSYFFRAGYEHTVRDFADTEAAPGAARTYHAYPIPGYVFSAEAYPLFDGMLGAEGSFAQSLGVQSMTSDSTWVSTTYLRAEAALKGRLFLSPRSDAPWIALFAGYGYTGYTFGAVPPDREIPSARYGAVRIGVDGRITVSRFHFVGAAEYDHLVLAGDLGPSRVRTPGNGFGARLGGGFAMTPWLAANFEGRLTWVRYDFDRSPAAYGVDRYITFALTLEASF